MPCVGKMSPKSGDFSPILVTTRLWNNYWLNTQEQYICHKFRKAKKINKVSKIKLRKKGLGGEKEQMSGNKVKEEILKIISKAL